MTDNPAIPRPFSEALDRLGDRWGWILFFGVLMLVLGLVALELVVTATIASVLTIGFFMIVTGIFEIGLGFTARTWGRFFLWIVAGLLYVLAGLVAVSQPLIAASIFTLMLGAGLVATGILRIVLAFQLSAGQPKTMVVLSGILTLLLGIFIVVGWPGNTFFILGMFLAIDLIFYGIGWIFFGLALRSRRRA